MRTFTTTHTVYTFDELSEEAQRKAIEDRQQFISETWEGDYIIDNAKITLQKYGFDNAEIEYSGFYSQGDGLSFTADVDVRTWLKEHKLTNRFRAVYANYDVVELSIYKHAGLYSHSNMMDYWQSYRGEENRKLEDQLEELAGVVLVNARTLADRIYKSLRDDYEAALEDENIIENIKANEYEFNADGSLAQ